MAKNLIKDLSILTTIPERNLNRLGDLVVCCISNAIQDSILQEKTITELDIYIGILYIQHEDNEIKYKFIPSNKLDKNVKDTVINKLNSLEIKITKSLISKVVNTYKNLL